MAKDRTKKELFSEPLYDHLVRGVGRTAIVNGQSIFGAANIGNLGMTNLSSAGVLPSDSAKLVRQIGWLLHFQSMNDNAWNVAFGATPAVTNAQANHERNFDMIAKIAYGCTFTFKLSGKPQVTAPIAWAPASMGVFGQTTLTNRYAAGNNHPQAALNLKYPILIDPRQTFAMTFDAFPYLVLGVGNGGVIPAGIDPLVDLNQIDGWKQVLGFVQGPGTRDVL